MTDAIVYNLRSSSLGYAITKWVDGEPEGSYHTSHAECDCPAGSRPTCRHRQMLPRMLAANLLDSPGFWDHDRNQTCDIDGRVMALPKGPKEDISPPLPKGPEIEPAIIHNDLVDEAIATAKIDIPDYSQGVPLPPVSWRRL